jgi:hypothetical protein
MPVPEWAPLPIIAGVFAIATVVVVLLRRWRGPRR